MIESTTKWTGPVWKLTNRDHTTRGSTLWGNKVTNPCGVRSGIGGLCSGGFYHAYESPYIAVLMNPQHGNFKDPVLWQAEYRGAVEDDHGLKFGATEFRTVRIVQTPVFTTNQQVAFAIFCAAQVWDEDKYPDWHEWAAKWLAGEDRGGDAAKAAANDVYAAAAAAYAAAAAAAYATYDVYAAAKAAAAAASAAAYAGEKAAANDVSAAAKAAASAAYAAAYATYAANAAEPLETAIAWALAFEPE